MIKQLFDLVYGFLHLKCIIKQLLDSVFVICRIINVEVRVIGQAEGEADNSYRVIVSNIIIRVIVSLLLYIAVV